MGTPQAAVPSLERLITDGHEIAAVYTQPDRPSGRGNKILFSPVKQAALERQINVYQPGSIKTPEAAEIFRSHMADLAVVVAYGRILPEAFLMAYRNGAINVHFSLLPKYRGAAPVNWAIVNGESETGVTTMTMDSGLDTGDILLQSRTSIGVRETAPELLKRLSLLGGDLLTETLSSLETVVPQSQNHSLATNAPIMARPDGLIDWRASAFEIERRVRGFQPFPNAFTVFNGLRLTIWMGNAFAAPRESQHGQILEAHDDRFVVSCGETTTLEVIEVQLEGKRRMNVRDFLNGTSVPVGTLLG